MAGLFRSAEDGSGLSRLCLAARPPRPSVKQAPLRRGFFLPWKALPRQRFIELCAIGKARIVGVGELCGPERHQSQITLRNRFSRI